MEGGQSRVCSESERVGKVQMDHSNYLSFCFFCLFDLGLDGCFDFFVVAAGLESFLEGSLAATSAEPFGFFFFRFRLVVFVCDGVLLVVSCLFLSEARDMGPLVDDFCCSLFRKVWSSFFRDLVEASTAF